MSFQLENSYTQPKNKPLGGHNNLLLGDHHGDVLISRVIPITLDLFDIKQSPPRLKSQEPCFVFTRDDTFLNSKSKRKRSVEKYTEYNMSQRNSNNNNNNTKVSKLDLKLNLSPPSSRIQTNPNPNSLRTESPTRSPSVSPPSSCISSDYLSMSSPESSPMVLVGCPRCLMYVMLSEDDPKCPKCKSTVLLDFVHDINNDNDNDNDNDISGNSKKTKKG